jgi:hypothetical protein
MGRRVKPVVGRVVAAAILAVRFAVGQETHRVLFVPKKNPTQSHEHACSAKYLIDFLYLGSKSKEQGAERDPVHREHLGTGSWSYTFFFFGKEKTARSYDEEHEVEDARLQRADQRNDDSGEELVICHQPENTHDR